MPIMIRVRHRSGVVFFVNANNIRVVEPELNGSAIEMQDGTYCRTMESPEEIAGLIEEAIGRVRTMNK